MAGTIIDADKLQNQQFINKDRKKKEMKEKIKQEISRLTSEMFILKSLINQYIEME